ncbi:MAG: hypothetical protein M3N46_10150 [Actinomycetota bacterium]|nr:hypothetical protein [Actinomycetota bacterium]
MPRRTRRPRLAAPMIAALALTVAVALAGCTSSGPAASGSPTTGSTPSASKTASAAQTKLDVATHLVAQEGLAIALASNVLQTQLLLVQDANADGPVGCTALTGGGAHAVSGWGGSSSARTLTDTIYYDAGCSKPYLVATASVNTTNSGATATASVAYTGTAGAALGTLATSASATFVGNGIKLEGTGTFTRAGAGPVSLGLACQSASDTVLNCQGGVTQDFTALGHALGSVTPLQLTVGGDVSNPITFTGSGSSTAVAPLGALSITSPDAVNLAIAGATPATTTITTTGQAGGFVLFPPTPTGWTITDAADDVAFAISVVDNTTRALTATVTQLSTKKVLAQLALDQSGTGTVTYAGQKAAPVGSWMLTS